MEDEGYWHLITNLTLAKFCYDYDKEQFKRFLSRLNILSCYPEEMLDYCFSVIAPGTRIYLNETIINQCNKGEAVKVVVIKHPIIEKSYSLLKKTEILSNHKYYNALNNAIKNAEEYLSDVAKCFDKTFTSLLENKDGVINRYYLELHGSCIYEFEMVLYDLVNCITTLKHAYKEVTDMLYDKGVGIC